MGAQNMVRFGTEIWNFTMKVVNQSAPTPERFQEFFGAEDTGPFMMVNLLKFREKAEYADGHDSDLTGREAFALYGAEVGKLILKAGGTPGFAGPVSGLMLGEVEELWDMVALVQYPSLDAFKQMITSPEYQIIAQHREAGLAGQLNIKAKA
jgi:uncharacterized protein (DUF1330 family)